MFTINRRGFLKYTALAGGQALLSATGAAAFVPAVAEPLTILHTNDVHSHLEPFPMDGGPWQGLGGVVARDALIRQVRKEVQQVLLLDAGDIFQGTPYFNLYKGEPDIQAMNRMQYDAVTIGNHDFDAGLDNYAIQLQRAAFPVVTCNYDFSHTPMEGKSKPYQVFQKGFTKVGVFGIGIELEGLVADNLYGNTRYLDPLNCANQTAEILRKKEGCTFIICLSHLGDKYFNEKISDEIIAKESFDIDLIIGGHTHRFFEAPKKYTNRRKGDVIVNQVGWGGIQLGRLDFEITAGGKKNLAGANTVVIAKKTSD